MVGLWYRRKLRGTREASNCRKVRVCIIHGLNISHKELTYLLRKSMSHRNKVLRACSYGDRLIGKYHHSSPTATHKEDNKKYLMLQLHYITIHHTCMLRDSQTITQVFLKFTTTYQHDFNITIFISQNYCKESNISYSAIYKFYVGFYD